MFKLGDDICIQKRLFVTMETENKALRVSTFALTIISLLADILGLGKLAYDVIVQGNVSDLLIKVLLLALAFLFGVGLGYLGMKGFKNTTIPSVARLYAWIYLGITCASYFGVAVVFSRQDYTFITFLAFVLVVAAELLAIMGLHVVIEELDLRLLSIPLLSVAAFHIILILYRYILTAARVTFHLVGDLFFFIGMTMVSSAMYGDIGFATMLRRILQRIRR